MQQTPSLLMHLSLSHTLIRPVKHTHNEQKQVRNQPCEAALGQLVFLQGAVS